VTSKADRRKSIERWALWLAIAVPVAVVIIYLLIWYGPDVIARHDVGNITGPLRVLRLQQARDAARGRLLTLGAGLFAAGALIFTAQNYRLARQTLHVTEQGQVTDRYTKAIEQLGSYNKLDVRIGGIYALERVARDSARDHPTVMEVLAAFIREHSREPWPLPNSDGSPEPERRFPRPDVQAALTVVGRRDVRSDRQRIDLTAAILPGALLFRTDLTRARLVDADLSGAELADANLSNANLTRTKLADANLTAADLTAAMLGSADLGNATLWNAKLDEALLLDADLTSANLTNALLTKADLTGAKLAGANLMRADLTDANLTGANLTRAALTGADLTRADLTGAVLTSAVLTGANLRSADLGDANLNHANLTRAKLAAADLVGAILTDADLTGATLAGAALAAANLVGAILTDADLTGTLWPPDAAVPEGWKRGGESGRLSRTGPTSGH
jgi:uncharacterized protein YjbI with pentapeptide repeats